MARQKAKTRAVVNRHHLYARRSILFGSVIISLATGLISVIAHFELSRADTSVTIMAAGDIACKPDDDAWNGGNGTSARCRQKETSDGIIGANPNYVLTLGDNQYENGELSNYNKAYHSSWGRFKSKTRPSPGNHEYRTDRSANGYFTYFGSLAGERGKGYYSWNAGSWHMISLNSNCSIVSCAAGSAQERWLRADLAANKNACVLAYWHHPRFSSGDHGTNNNESVKPFWDALYAAKADIILNGHDHSYERFRAQNPNGVADSNGIVQWVVGTGGLSKYGFRATKPNSVARTNVPWDVLFLRLKPTGYDWGYGNRGYSDRGSGTCVGLPKPEPPKPPSNPQPPSNPKPPTSGNNRPSDNTSGNNSSSDNTSSGATTPSNNRPSSGSTASSTNTRTSQPSSSSGSVADNTSGTTTSTASGETLGEGDTAQSSDTPIKLNLQQKIIIGFGITAAMFSLAIALWHMHSYLPWRF